MRIVQKGQPVPRKTAICQQPGCPNLRPCPTHKPTPWQGSTRRTRLPPEWARIRTLILNRDGHACVICGQKKKLEIDHMGHPDNHHPDNLQTLCTRCHRTKTLRQAETARRRTRNDTP